MKSPDSPDRSATVEVVATRLRQLRARAGLKQAEVAACVGCDSSSVSKWESGRHSTPSCPELLALARLFDVSVSYIVGQVDSPQPSAVGRALIDRRLLDALLVVRSAEELDALIRKQAGDRLWVEVPEGAETVTTVREAVRAVRSVAEQLAARFPDSPHPARLLKLDDFP